MPGRNPSFGGTFWNASHAWCCWAKPGCSSWKITNSAPLLSSLACNRKWNFVAKAWAFWRQKEEIFCSWGAQVFCEQKRNICSWCAQAFCNRKKKNLELKCSRFLQQKEEFGAEAVKCFPTERTRIWSWSSWAFYNRKKKLELNCLSFFQTKRKRISSWGLRFLQQKMEQ